MPRSSLLLNWLSPSAQNWQVISLKYRLSYFGNFFLTMRRFHGNTAGVKPASKIRLCLFAENPVVSFSPSFVLNKTYKFLTCLSNSNRNFNRQKIGFPSFLVFALCSGLLKISSVKLQNFCDRPFTCWLRYFPAKFRKILSSGLLEINEFPVKTSKFPVSIFCLTAYALHLTGFSREDEKHAK